MKDNMFGYVRSFVYEVPSIYIEDIRDGNNNAFTRNRKLSPFQLLLQMFSQKGKTQLSELIDLYKDFNTNLDVSTVAFYKARMNFNPNAIKLMSKDFISDIYDKEDESLIKLNGYYVTAIDGSDIILPSTAENAKIYGRYDNGSNNNDTECPVMAKLSIVYDCINKCSFDSEIGRYKHSERDFASKHLDALKEMLRVPTITVFDRGYYSIRLLDQLEDNEQKYLFRLKTNDLNRLVKQVDLNEDKTFNLTFDRLQTNMYRHDNQFRMKIMNTSYNVRIVKVPIIDSKTGNEHIEILLTNLTQEEFDIISLKELYKLRWEVETAYNVLKNKMKLEEFSGYREWLIRQDIYTCIWLYNIVMLRIIEVNEEQEIPEDRYKYKMKYNVNIAVGLIKSCFVKSLIYAGEEESIDYFNHYTQMIDKHLVPVRPNRKYKRGNTKNKSRMSYRYTY